MLIDFVKNVLMFTVKEAPKTLGIYHFFCLAVVIALCIVLCKFCKNMSDKTYRKMVLITGIVMILFEIYKLTIYSMDIDDHNVVTWDFPWYLFPFQFCSSPLYVFPLVGIIKDGKIRKALMTYMSTFMLFAGAAVMCYPGDCFVRTVGIDIQTMAVHGSMVVLGVFNLASGRCEFTLKNMLSGIITFAVFISIAMAMNVTYYFIGPDETFNMFYISPFYVCHLPILSIVYAKAPYPVFLLTYLLGFSLCAFIMFNIGKVSVKLSEKAALNKKVKQNNKNLKYE